MNKRILMLTQVSSGGGAERVMSHLANYFSEKGHCVTYASITERGYYPLSESIQKIAFGGRSLLEEIRNIRRFLRHNEFDSIVAFGYLAAIRVAIATVGLACQKRIVMSERNDPSSNVKSKIKQRLRIWAYGRAKKMVFQTEDAMRYFPLRVQKRGVVIPNPLIMEDIPKAAPINSKRIIAAGRVSPQKNFAMMIDAFAVFHKTHPEYVLDIFGGKADPVEFERLEKQIKELELDGGVYFKGFSNDLAKEFAQSSMYLSSSDYEGISNSMLEAMSCGLPVICTDCPCGGARMMIDNRVNGILVPTRDYKAMATAMCEIVENAAFASELAENASRITDRLSLDKIATAWLEVV